MNKEQIIKEHNEQLLAKAREKYKATFKSPEERSEHFRKLQKLSAIAKKKKRLSTGDEVRNINAGKSRCCKAKVEWVDGGYDGERIVSVSSYCTKCMKREPKVIMNVGRPAKVPF
jgi:hypothetical protein